MGKTSDKTVYKTTGWCGFGSGSNTVTMQEEGNAEGEVLTTTTDEFGDFWFRQVEGKKYHLWFEAEGQGFVTREIAGVDATAADQNVGRVTMYKMIPLG